MNDEVSLTRSQLQNMGADQAWFDAHMKGRGRLALSRVIQCAPPGFYVLDFTEDFTGVVRYATGSEFHYEDGMLHREDGPAEICQPSGNRYWRRYGAYHREDGPAMIEPAVGESYYLDGVHLESMEQVEVAAPLVRAMRKQGCAWWPIANALIKIRQNTPIETVIRECGFDPAALERAAP
jgi:hypothetical protein